MAKWMTQRRERLASVCLVQSLRDVGDQIGRVFDADRQPDR
jgi:hypothetical protein